MQRTTLVTLACVVGLSGCAEPATSTLNTLEPWPFTVDEVRLECAPGTRQVFVTTTDGRRYAVNGSARSEAPLMREIQAEVDLHPLIMRGLALCESGRNSERLRAPPAQQAQPAGEPAYSVQPSELGPGIVAIAEADTLIGGARPTLQLICEDGRAPMLMFDLIEAPRTPPPLRGVYATFDTGNGQRRIEMAWGTDADWTLRSGDARVEDRELANTMLQSGQLTFHADNAFMPRRISWDLNRFGQQLAQIQTQCR